MPKDIRHLPLPIVAGVRVHPEVASALAESRPVVALETAVVTHGLPRQPLPSSRLNMPALDRSAPVNLALALAMQKTVRDAGAIPATIAVLQGELCIGLDEDELVMLAEEKCAAKASSANLAHIMATGGSAGTTVSATLAALKRFTISDLRFTRQSRIVNRKSEIANPLPPFTFATGGIGGVHRGWQTLPDISADLSAIAQTPICIVCSGAKSILDVPATLEALETLGVPIVGYQTSHFPQFITQSKIQNPKSKIGPVHDLPTAARLCHTHWSDLHQTTGIILANPVPDEYAIDEVELDLAIEQAEALATSRHITGSQRTPFLLSEIARLTNGRILDANLALLLNNARLAAELARALYET